MISTKTIDKCIKDMIEQKLSYKSIANELQHTVGFVKERAKALDISYSTLVLSEKERRDIFGRSVRGDSLDAIVEHYGIRVEDIDVIVRLNTLIPAHKQAGFSKKLDPFKEEIIRDCKKGLTLDDMVDKYRPLTHDKQLSYATMQQFRCSIQNGKRKEYPRAVPTEVNSKQKIQHKQKTYSKPEIALTLSQEAYVIAKNMSTRQLSSTLNRVLIRQA